MRKTLATLTIGILAIAVAVMAVAGISAPKTSATSGLCHTSTLSYHGARQRQGREEHHRDRCGAPAAGAHRQRHAAVSAAAGTKWTNGRTTTLSSGRYWLKWKAPAKKGKYKIRVRVTHSGSSNTSAAKTVSVE